MNHKLIIQCKKVILNNKRNKNYYVNFNLADKLYFRHLNRKIKKDGNIDNISFEDFVLLCKHHKIVSHLKVDGGYSVKFIGLLDFDCNTLYRIINDELYQIIFNKDTDKYSNVDINLLLTEVKACNNVILFEHFMKLCRNLNIKVDIE